MNLAECRRLSYGHSVSPRKVVYSRIFFSFFLFSSHVDRARAEKSLVQIVIADPGLVSRSQASGAPP